MHDEQTQNYVLAMKQPRSRTISFKANDSPTTLPDLERILDERILQVLFLPILGFVVLASPVHIELQEFVIRVTDRTIFSWTRVQELRHQKTGGLVDVAPLKVGHIDNLEWHSVKLIRKMSSTQDCK